MKTYDVLKGDWFQGVWKDVGETVSLTDRQAKYAEQSGTIALQKSTRSARKSSEKA